MSAETAKLVLISEKLSFETLKAAKPEEVDELARQFVKKGEKVKDARTDYKTAAKATGKVYCALEIRLNTGKEARLFPANKPLAEFIKDVSGEKPPTHALTLKNAFGGFVITGLITEKDYDLNSNNCLELAARILDAVKGDMTHDAVTHAAEELKARGDKEAANLRDILATVKPKELTAEKALEMFKEICKHGHLPMVLVEVPDTIKGMADDKEQRQSYKALATAIERTDETIGAETVDAWLKEAIDMNTPLPVTPGATAREDEETVEQDDVETAAA